MGQALGNSLFHTTQAGRPYQFYRPDCTSNPSDEQVDITPPWRGLTNRIVTSFCRMSESCIDFPTGFHTDHDLSALG